MGVMKCSRSGCENILCNNYIDDIGHICHECKEEFINRTLAKGKNYSLKKLKVKLHAFMDYPKGGFDTYQEREILINNINTLWR